ncbi:MAG: DUF481 domain-containing protein [Candidatus Peribacteraceae bacterium]|nr:DUF481 domain-containing protein [Candidatus Peribacteraceae bacterium]
MRKLKTALLSVLFLAILSGIAFAGLDISYNNGQNSIDSHVISVRVNKQIETISFSAEYNKGKVSNIVSANGGYIRIGYDPEITEKLHLWFYDQFGFNKMASVNIENFIGGGPKYIVTSGVNYKFSSSFGVLYHYQELDDNTEERLARYSSRIKGHYNTDMIEFEGVAFHQPNMENFGDYILYGELSFGLILPKSASIKYIITNEYRSEAEPAERNNFTQGLYFGFGF